MWVKCITSAECVKTVITVVLTVMSGLDPRMINLFEVDNKSLIPVVVLKF